MSAPVLYEWPPAASFGRVVPKTKFYEHGTVTAAVREKFVADVRRITWAYKLANETVHLRGDASVPEIQVFVVDAKGADVSDDILAAIDTTVPFPIIFELLRAVGDGTHIRMVASHKQLGGGKPKLSAYFSTEWLPTDTPRTRMPAALDLPSLYAGLLEPILPVATRPGERLSDATARLDQARKLEREIKTLERRLRNEPQLNRKVELRRKLRARSMALAALTDPAPPSAKNDPEKDAQWTS